MEHTKVYTQSGTVVHALGLDASPNDVGGGALCGRTPWPGLWHGTGSQEEEDTAMDMPVCTPCLAVLRYQNMGRDPKGWEER